MKILVLTQYFPPETGAPQNRLFDLAQKLRLKGAEVSILTAFPNYPQYEIFPGYQGRFFMQETLEGLNIIRSWIYVSQKKSIFFRLLNYFSFTISSFLAGVFKVGKVDIIICESPPLFLGFTAVLLKWIKRAQLVFNVSDLWPESAVKLGLIQNKQLISLSEGLENWIYRHSDKISGQTQGIVNDIKGRFPSKPVFWLRNGTDMEELTSRLKGIDWRSQQGFAKEDVLFYFGGLIGYAQALDCIIQAAAILKGIPNAKFIIIGDGPDKDRLVDLKTQLQANNVYFFKGVPKGQIADIIHSIDIGIIPLKKIDLFLGAIPSKIFEILSLKKPVLLGVEGEAKMLFIDEAKAGLAFEPENPIDLARKITFMLENQDQLVIWGQNGHAYVNEYFNRHTIANDFYTFIQ